MPDFVDDTVKDIDRRLSELQEEVKRLVAARSALLGIRRGPGRPRGSKSAPSRSSRSRTSGRRPGRPRGRRRNGTRSVQALELVRANPGITIPDIAQQLAIEPNYLYRVMPRLVADGQVRREGQGWHPAT